MPKQDLVDCMGMPNQHRGQGRWSLTNSLTSTETKKDSTTMQGSWRSKKWGYIVGPDTWPILATLVPIVGAAVSFFGFTSIWVLFHNPEVQ